MSKVKITPPEIKKLSPILTDWLLNDAQPKLLNIEDTCVLKDPKQEERIIRIQKQDLSAKYVQSLTKNNFEISQMKITWNDQVTFVLKDDFTFQSLQYKDTLIESSEDKNDSEEACFKADFFIMSGVLTKIFSELLKVFAKNSK